MLTAVKNQIKISLLSIKYSIMREMLNKASFITNIIFMILNNACFIVQWIVLFSIKKDIGGYSLDKVILLWGLASSTFGFSRFFFKKAFSLSEIINNGKLDSYLVQPKNVLLSVITTDVEPSALGDMIYGYIMLFVYGITLNNFLLFTLFTISGGLVLTSISIMANSLSFWFNKSELLAEKVDSFMTTFATYPGGIFKGITKVILYTIIPVGLVNYIPIEVITNFDLGLVLLSVGVSILFVTLAFIVFYRGLKRYTSSNLMVAKI